MARQNPLNTPNTFTSLLESDRENEDGELCLYSALDHFLTLVFGPLPGPWQYFSEPERRHHGQENQLPAM